MTRRWVLAVALAVAAAGTVPAGACSDENENGSTGDRFDRSDESAPSTSGPADSFEAVVCPATMRWSSSIVVIANDFADLSRPLDDDPDERRRVYLDTFDRVVEATDELAEAVAAAPSPDSGAADTISDGMVEAAEGAAAELTDAREAAEGLSKADYRFRSVRGGELYMTTEKARAIVFHALGDLAEEHDYPALAGRCGRR